VDRPLSPQEDQAWRPYIEGSLRLESHLDDTLRAETGLSLFDYHVLLLLSEAPQQRLRMNELADKMVFSRSRITYQVTSMQKRGLVARETVAEDGRGSRAVLTATGLDTLRKAAPHHARTVRESFLADLAPADLAAIGRIFGRLRDRMEQRG
jgi:DNA-binding MarR family transcriptional regulator